MDFIKRINYTKNFTLLFILTGTSFAILIVFVIFSELKTYQYKSDKDKAQYEINLKKEKTLEFYEHFEKFLFTITTNRFFTSYINNPTNEHKKDLITLFETLSKHEKYITQLRYINNQGQEIVRIDKVKINTPIKLIEKNNLQNKKHRDYFIETMKKNKNEIFVSKLDLNIENKKIEIPYKPVLRFATPVFLDFNKQGIIVVNIFAQSLLNEISDSKSFDVDIYDQDKHILVSSNKKNWTRYLDNISNIKEKKYIYKDILIDTKNGEILYIGLTPKDSLNHFLELINKEIFFLILIVIFISFVLGKLLAIIPKKLFDELDKQQKILIQQSKIAAMGEMTSMLAHQWRQPLNAISVLMQEMQIKFERDILTKEEQKSITENIKHKLMYMSKTIDNFRDFLKPQKERKELNIIDLIDKSFSIVDIKLKNANIKYKILYNKDNYKNFIIKTFQDELEQVFINLLNNSIDAIQENTKEDEKKYIHVSIKLDKNQIIIKFEDSGKGIKNEVLENLFEPYSSTKLEKNGSGLGLYMSKIIIEKNMNGQIEVSNTKEGACFKLILNKE
ncbi:HAMP domain-containing sensor histidine kinase [Halarcobacter sp.]|uniref:sensor histidine kinase n=1 Tax=Halarcobacter sp. TaxID=2321133 RepID=UPI0029F4D53B|nr:HAMP domain-containing sensor histidine kinase [Halarcobacter sp.]